MERPPNRWKCICITVWPPSLPTLVTTRPSLRKVQFLGEFCRHRKDMRHNRAVFFCNVRCRLDVLLRDQQNMYRRLGSRS